MFNNYIIAGKEEGFLFRDAKIVKYYGDDPGPLVDNLKTEGYTQFIFTKQTGYEYILDDGEVIKG